MHEVVLQVNLEAKAGDKVVWLLELQQAGAVPDPNLSANDLGQVLSIMAPNYLLGIRPCDRRGTREPGRLPAVHAAVVTFEALHAHAQQQARPGRRSGSVN